MRGVRMTSGSDLRIPAGALRVSFGSKGELSVDPVIPHLRTDMWPYWLLESVESARAARDAGDEVAKIAREADRDEEALDLALSSELRASMRAITSAAFAVDAFYASVKARSPAHPHSAQWVAGRTPRHAQVFETIRYHLKVRSPGAKEIRARIKELFKYRDWAVHPGSRFREPIYRDDVDAGVDWHFMAFRGANAVAAVGMAVSMMDVLVSLLPRGSEELRENHPGARRAMNRALAAYDEAGFPYFQRADDPQPPEA